MVKLDIILKILTYRLLFYGYFLRSFMVQKTVRLTVRFFGPPCINRQLAVNKLKRSTNLIEFTLNMQCCQSRKQNQTVLFFQ